MKPVHAAPRSYPQAPVAPSEASVRAAFEEAYREKFALTPPNVPVEFINVRVAMRAPVAAFLQSPLLQRHRNGITYVPT